MSGLLILAPLRIERRALSRGARSARVVRIGMGPRAAARLGERLRTFAASGSVAVAGFCGGLQPGIRTGDVIVASEVRGPGTRLVLPSAGTVAETLGSAGLIVHLGPIVSTDRVALGARRAAAGSDGSLGVDMESYWLLHEYLAPAEGGGPVHLGIGAQPAKLQTVVVRAVSDTVEEPFLGGMVPLGWLRAYRSLVQVGAVLEEWGRRGRPNAERGGLKYI